MCTLYSITTNQEAIRQLFRVVNRYVGNLAPMPGVFPDYPAPVVRNTETGREPSHFAGPNTAARKLVEIAHASEAVQDGHIGFPRRSFLPVLRRWNWGR